MKIFKYPSKYLTQKTEEVYVPEWNDSDLPSLVETMKHLVNEEHSRAALAANQVGLPWRLFVVNKNVAEAYKLPELVINPKMAAASMTKSIDGEGCLSFPGIRIQIYRYDTIVCQHTLLDGSEAKLPLEGFPARLFQHEIEHLEGQTFLNNLPRMDKFRIIEKLRKR